MLPTLECLSEQDRAAVRESAGRVLAEPMAVSEEFYRRVFAARPGLRALFPADMHSRHHKLLRTLGALLDALERSEDRDGLLRRLGAAHRMYGAKAAHYPIINQALLDTLAQRGGAGFGEQHRQAWARLLAAVSHAMLRGAED